ncbi:MAG: transcriptional regulator FtrA [Rhodobacteraceae bacterium]|nr:transcriptional regulator FtrA [Paracoccaceae bacterium]MBR26625.1 transcriptional regulator FtrA [Paracoccaceae bacterium]
MPDPDPDHISDPASAPHRIVAVVYDGLCTFEFGIVTELFALPRPEFDFPWYDFSLAAAERRPGGLRAMGGFRVQVDAGLEALATADTVVIPGWRDRDEAPPAPLVEAIRAAHVRGARMLAICSGGFVLGAAGVLEGRRVTTHWRHMPAMKARFPGVELAEDALYVEDRGVITSAGSSAGIDAGLHLIRADHGARVANIVARRLVMPPHREGGQAQYVDAPVQLRPGRSLAAVLDWARGELARPVAVAEMADRAGMSERSFLRRFREATGTTPLKWLRRERVTRAMKLLEETGLALDDVGANCGFGSAEAFRKAFGEVAGVAPGAYRARFRREAAAGGGIRAAG